MFWQKEIYFFQTQQSLLFTCIDQGGGEGIRKESASNSNNNNNDEKPKAGSRKDRDKNGGGGRLSAATSADAATAAPLSVGKQQDTLHAVAQVKLKYSYYVLQVAGDSKEPRAYV